MLTKLDVSYDHTNGPASSRCLLPLLSSGLRAACTIGSNADLAPVMSCSHMSVLPDDDNCEHHLDAYADQFKYTGLHITNADFKKNWHLGVIP